MGTFAPLQYLVGRKTGEEMSYKWIRIFASLHYLFGYKTRGWGGGGGGGGVRGG